LPPSRPLNQLGQLVDAFVSKVAFEKNWGYDPDRADELSYGIESSTTGSVGESGKSGLVILKAEVEWTSEAEDLQPPFSLQVEVAGVFALRMQGLEEDEIRDWLEFNGEHLLWPYLRAAIQSVTASSDLPPLTIYTIGVPRPRLGDATIAESASGPA
jgi:preprotein translocase subunit SecB